MIGNVRLRKYFMRVVFLGAGSIGCFVGGCWQAAGLDIGFIGRRAVATEISANGLTLSDHNGWKCEFSGDQISFSADPALLSDAQVVIVTVKSVATEEAAALIASHVRSAVPVLSLQNGISNVETVTRAPAGQSCFGRNGRIQRCANGFGPMAQGNIR